MAIALTYKHLHNSFSGLLNITRDALGSDPHDRIYALLGLVEAHARTHIVPDYEKNIEDLYRQVTWYDIESKRSLDIFLQCSLIEKQPSLQSWVPDWSVKKLTMYIDRGRAAGSSCAEVTFHGTFIDVAGVSFSALKSRGPSIVKGYSYYAQLSKWEPPNLLSAFYLNGEPMIDAYCATLIGNLNVESTGNALIDPTKAHRRTAFLRAIYSGCDRAQRPNPEDLRYTKVVRNVCHGRIFIWTESGHMGLVPASAQIGDIVCVFLGCVASMVVRPTKDKDHYLLVGSCYTHGLMDSEALLGPLPNGWRIYFSLLGNYLYVSPDGMTTHQDPRLWPLMSDWELGYDE
jgi:hypothetical protein